MQYGFVLGRESELSLGEIIQVLQAQGEKATVTTWSSQMAIFNLIDFQDFKRLGGSIKFGEMEKYGDDDALSAIEDMIRGAIRTGKRLRFGISVYPASKEVSREELFGWQEDIAQFAFELKQHLKIEKVSSRFVTSKQSQLSSVVVNKNGLTEEGGVEVLVGIDTDGIWVGQTLEVQDFETFSHLDFDRPARDDVSGMLPPKLARMMLNLGGIEIDQTITVLDPHCGSGTVLQEAALLGAGKVLGSDISQKAVSDSEENINWLKQEVDIASEIKIEQVDARELTSWLPQDFVDLIATESFLGEPVKGKLSDKEIKQRQQELSDLYAGILEQVHKVIKPEGRVVFLFPYIGKYRLPLPKGFEKQWQVVNIFEGVTEVETQRGGIDYKRPGQHVGREIMVLKKR